MQMSSIAAVSSQRYTVQFGVASTQIGPNFAMYMETTEEGNFSPGGLIFQSLPAGTQLMVRATCNTTAQAIQVAAYLVH